MTKRKSDFTLPTYSLDDLFSSQEERDDAKLERVKEDVYKRQHLRSRTDFVSISQNSNISISSMEEH